VAFAEAADAPGEGSCGAVGVVQRAPGARSRIAVALWSALSIPAHIRLIVLLTCVFVLFVPRTTSPALLYTAVRTS
jgi:hypothetical protein